MTAAVLLLVVLGVWVGYLTGARIVRAAKEGSW